MIGLFLLAYLGRGESGLPASILQIMYVGNVLGTMGLLSVLIYLFNTEIMRAEHALHKANHDLEQLSLTDELTGLTNRRSLMAGLAREWSHARRENLPLSLMMCDVDEFKRYNDNYGHQAGDHVLRQIAGVFVGLLRRPSDMVARYGGEEFVFVLPNTDRAGARAMGERLLHGVRDLAITHAYSSAGQSVSISLGIVTMDAGENIPGHELLAAADKALYAAKLAGRDRLHVANAPALQHQSPSDQAGTLA